MKSITQQTVRLKSFDVTILKPKRAVTDLAETSRT